MELAASGTGAGCGSPAGGTGVQVVGHLLVVRVQVVGHLLVVQVQAMKSAAGGTVQANVDLHCNNI